MRAVVLVGGEGTRLRPLTWTTPKQMLPIVEIPMIVRVLEALARHGVDEAVLSLGYRPDAFVEAFPDSVAAGVRLVYAVEPTPLDTAGAVRFAALAGGMEETFVVVNGDVLTDLDLGGLVKLHRERGAACTVALTPVANPSAFGIVVTDDDGRVETFVEKPAPGTEPGNLANAGIYVMEPEVVARVPDGRRVSIERETFPLLAGEGELYAFGSECYWLDTGTPRQYVQAQLDIVAGKRQAVSLPPAEEVAPGVHVAPGAELSAQLRAPSWAGAGVTVARGAEVSTSVLSAGAAVAAGAVVTRSVLLAGARVAEGARVEDSVVGPGAVVGAGARLRHGTVVAPQADVPPGLELSDARFPTTSPA